MKKIFSIFAICSLALMTTLSCDKIEDENPLPLPDENAEVIENLQGMDVTPKTGNLVIGETYQLSAVFSPENVGELTVSWASENPDIATVDDKGMVTAVSTGIARIIASSNGKKAAAIINVVGERVPATEIVLNKTEVNTLVGRYTKLKATLMPEETTDKPAFEWTSSDTKIATVEYGVVVALAMGDVTITATQGDLSASCKVTVADKIKLQDRSSVWKISDTPKWDKDWYGNISGSHVEVALSDCDAEYHYFEIVEASKFTDIETISNDLYMKVEEARESGDPKNLFKTGETETRNYSNLGEAVAYVLGFDSDFEFTGEYARYDFEAKTPDPVHATGMKFTQGWNDSEITEIVLKEGKSMQYFKAVLLPDDCTDTGDISYSSSDESIVTIAPYYSGYYTVSAVSAGEASIIARFNDIEASIPVTVTGSDIVWKDRSADWAGEFKMGKLWGYYDVFGFSLESCDSPSHFIAVVQASQAGSDPMNNYKAVASQNESSLSWYASSDIPDFSGSYGDTDESIERYAYVFGVSNGDYDGNYAIFHYTPGGGPDPGTDPSEGNVVSLDGQYFPLDWDDMDSELDEVTMEAWINSSSFSGGKDDIYTVMGTEGIFLLRFEGNKLNLVYGGEKKDNGEYAEKKVTYNAAFETGKWYHIAATYVRDGDVILYVNGEQVGSNLAEDHSIEMNGVGAEWVLPFKFYVGVSSNNRVFKGSLAYLRVWDCARSASEIKDNMKVADPSDDGYNLLASWYFNEGSGNEIADYGATGEYTLTASGDLSWVEGELPL